MKKKLLIPLTSVLVFGLLVTSCIPRIFGQQSEGSVAATAAAQTIQALETQSWIGTLEAELTKVAMGQTTQTVETSSEATPTSTIEAATETPEPSATAFIPTATQVPCLWAQFIKDVTIPDGTEIDPGKEFTKTWRLKNAGSCQWTSDFELIFVHGDQMDGPDTEEISEVVYPGETIDVSVDFTAPDEEGEYKGEWMLRSDDGEIFGLGVAHDTAFWVDIEVPEDLVTIDPDKPLNFAKYFKAADWSTSEGDPIFDDDDFENGSVYSTNEPDMEKNRTDDELSLIMIPTSGDDGYIEGKFPAINIEDGDHFTAVIGCTSDRPKCNVTFEIDYRIVGESTENLGSWDEEYDGDWTRLDIDLSDLAGESVRFYLRVLSDGSNNGDRVFWLLPRIERD